MQNVDDNMDSSDKMIDIENLGGGLMLVDAVATGQDQKRANHVLPCRFGTSHNCFG